MKLKDGGEAKDTIRKKYPVIRDLSLSKVSAGVVSVDVIYHPAELVLFNENIYVWYSNKSLYEIHVNDAISSGAIFAQLPDYFSGDQILQQATGFISLIGPEKIKNDFTMIHEVYPSEDILFLIGSQKSIHTMDNIRATFDHKRSIEAQLEYLRTITNLDPSFFYEIDLTTYPTVIIKRIEEGFPEL